MVLFEQAQINTLREWKEVKTVLECLHCLSKRTYYRDWFVDPKNNKLEDVRKYWKELLHTGHITREKIDGVVKALYSFGNSSAQELIGWYYPDKYPLMNSNSNCGMRFFGYPV